MIIRITRSVITHIPCTLVATRHTLTQTAINQQLHTFRIDRNLKNRLLSTTQSQYQTRVADARLEHTDARTPIGPHGSAIRFVEKLINRRRRVRIFHVVVVDVVIVSQFGVAGCRNKCQMPSSKIMCVMLMQYQPKIYYIFIIFIPLWFNSIQFVRSFVGSPPRFVHLPILCRRVSVWARERISACIVCLLFKFLSSNLLTACWTRKWLQNSITTPGTRPINTNNIN